MELRFSRTQGARDATALLAHGRVFAVAATHRVFLIVNQFFDSSHRIGQKTREDLMNCYYGANSTVSGAVASPASRVREKRTSFDAYLMLFSPLTLLFARIFASMLFRKNSLTVNALQKYNIKKSAQPVEHVVTKVLNEGVATTFMPKESVDKDGEAVLKVVQRFRKQPQEWPMEEQPFGIIERTFVGKTMHPVELRPERGFVNMVPFGFMMIRHFFRKVRAKGNYELFKATGIFDEKEVRAGTKRVFEVISQHAYKDNMKELVAKNVCGEDLIRRFEAASCNMSDRQRELLNVTEQDVYAIAPGVLGPFQLIRPLLRNKEPFISYSLLCCAFYKKQVLFDAVGALLVPTEIFHNHLCYCQKLCVYDYNRVKQEKGLELEVIYAVNNFRGVWVMMRQNRVVSPRPPAPTFPHSHSNFHEQVW
ncbi:hypothetical protein Y032_0071g537 [Ancylostoma ceylanicum]|uniref:Uncharacterized protein n=1 Tax=Ancylostoma ceylanicum TaxID=53326 RepID=A0A016TW09_9BILA|nr:hypothetical protein Y032_0071g537 [Ancylostoma ceylanicum]